MHRRLLVSVLLILLSAAPAFASNDPSYSRQWGMEKIGAPTAWQSGSGAGILIGIVDTGVDMGHPDLRMKIVGGTNLCGGGAPQDDDGHGSHVAGIAAAATGNSLGVAGVAGEAKILAAKVFDANEDCPDLGEGIRWAADNGAQVINMSAGYTDRALGDVSQDAFGPPFQQAVEYAWNQKGVVVVLSAGNQFLLTSGYQDIPALVVASTTRQDTKSDFSSGVGQAKWGISAPGGGHTADPQSEHIYSTYLNGYAYAAGTSMAAPHVAGAAAVLRGLGLSPQATVDRLLSTAKDLGSSGKDSAYGYGRLDLAKAVQGLGEPTSNTGGGSSSDSTGGAPRSGSSGGSAPKAGSTPAQGGGAQPQEDSPIPSEPEATAENDESAALDAEDEGAGLNWFIIGSALAVLGVGFFFLTRYLLQRSVK